MKNTIPPELKKYFLSRQGKLNTNYPYFVTLNKFLLQEIKCGEKEDILFTQINSRKKPLYFKADKDGCIYAFASNCWYRLKDDEKIRTVFTFINKYLKEIFNQNEMPNLHLIQAEEHLHIKTDGYFSPQRHDNEPEFLYLRPQKLASSNGIYSANIIAHELQHYCDFRIYKEEILPLFRNNFLKNPNTDIEDLEIIQLPIEDSLFNYKTRKHTPITPYLREQILLLKHFTNPIVTDSKKRTLDKVNSIDDMLELLEFLAYMYTPAEKRAFQKGCDIANLLTKKHIEFGIPQSTDDKENNEAINNNLDIVDSNMKMVENLLGIPMYLICDLFYKKQYYSSLENPNDKNTQHNEEISKELLNIAETAFNKYISLETPSL